MSNIEMQIINEQEEDTQKDRFLIFTLSSESYGIGIEHVTEIIGIQPVTAIPELPDYIRGIINLRGKIIPVMDIRLRFKKPFREYTDRTCVIVIDIMDVAVGLIVDGVSEVITIPETDIVAPSEITKDSSKYIRGIGKSGSEVMLLLDCNRLLKDDEAAALADIR